MSVRWFSLIFLTLVSLVVFADASGQESETETNTDEIAFTECLVISGVSTGGRVPIHRDAIEKLLTTGDWSVPKEGDSVTNFAGQERIWERVEAIEPGRFQDQRLRGWAYISYELEEPRTMILRANHHSLVYVNGEPRTGDVYGYNWLHIPVRLKAGLNEFLFLAFRGRLDAKLVSPKATAFFTASDDTLPDIVAGEPLNHIGAVVIANATDKPLKDALIVARHNRDGYTVTPVPEILPFSLRKVPFKIEGAIQESLGEYELELTLGKRSKGGFEALDSNQVKLDVKNANQPRKITFISEIDGSVQYFALNPASQKSDSNNPPALVLSCHGASVQAINLARSYAPKSWAHIVCPTNRRPFGFDWEDWGRWDAIEVLEKAQELLKPDPERIYLTGHSMGGHGTWHIGVTHPDRFAAIGPSAAWISFWSYGGAAEIENPTQIQEMLLRPMNPSKTLELGRNFLQQGIYILHGTDDDNVPVGQAREMVKFLSGFHKNFKYHEEPGVKHWWNKRRDVPGTDCVDWPPMFDFFARNRLPKSSELIHIEFHTASPSVSAKSHWITIEAQQTEYINSSVDVRLEPAANLFSGTTKNVKILKVDVSHLPNDAVVKVELDGTVIPEVKKDSENPVIWLERNDEGWSVINKPCPSQKGSHRYGSFRNAFRNNMIFVYGTQGTEEENAWAFAKARYDAEQFWYRGNGSIDVVADADFDLTLNSERNIILYGNNSTNKVWEPLLGDSPVNVGNGFVQIGERIIEGDDKGCLFVRPHPNSDNALVAAVSGTGVKGMRISDRLAYFVSGVGYPDVFVFGLETLEVGSDGVDALGFFGIDWTVENGEFVWKEAPNNK